MISPLKKDIDKVDYGTKPVIPATTDIQAKAATSLHTATGK
jgi:hypothetical protein